MDLGELSQSKCQAGTAKYFAHPEDCAKYYACGDDDEYNDEVTLNECPYPLLFNDELNRCEFHITVKCGKRRELKDPCKYIFIDNKYGRIIFYSFTIFLIFFLICFILLWKCIQTTNARSIKQNL